MKKLLSSVLVFALTTSLVPLALAEPHQVMQGTQMHLTLLNNISTSASRDGDPFVAVVAEPVYLGNELLIPAGARINGVVGTIASARHFSLVRGEAYMDLTFRSIEIDSRVIPVKMSIITLEKPNDVAEGKARRDTKIEEGGVVQEKHDYKGDLLAATIGTGGASLVGALFSHVLRGFGVGLAGSALYVVSRKGKEVVIPAHSGIVARMDSTINVPATSASNEPATSGN